MSARPPNTPSRPTTPLSLTLPAKDPSASILHRPHSSLLYCHPYHQCLRHKHNPRSTRNLRDLPLTEPSALRAESADHHLKTEPHTLLPTESHSRLRPHSRSSLELRPPSAIRTWEICSLTLDARSATMHQTVVLNVRGSRPLFQDARLFKIHLGSDVLEMMKRSYFVSID